LRMSCDKFGCGWDVQKPGPPENLPSWFRCPASINEKVYPAPPGVEIMPITEGGRNGPSKKRRFQCGQCSPGSAAPVKPNISGDCPMGKAQILGLGKDCGGLAMAQASAQGIFDKVKAFFSGLGKN